MSSLEQWPTQTEAADALETSTKTISRYASQGKLEIRKRRRPGKKPENVCNPRDIEKLKPTAFVMPESSSLTGTGPGKEDDPEASFSELEAVARELIQTISTAVKTMETSAAGPKLLEPPAARDPQEPPTLSVALDKKLNLTLKEASAYSGIARSALRRAAISGEIVVRRDGPRGAMTIKRSSLEAFAG